MFGTDCYYVPRTSDIDPIMGDDLNPRFESSYVVEMYLANADGFEGDGDLLTRLGIQIKDTAQMVVSRSRFQQETGMPRPKEGDLIFYPLSNTMFEIKHVQHESPFYQVGRNYVYVLSVETFVYSHQGVSTGNPAIDTITADYGYKETLRMAPGGTGDFTMGETVYQGASVADPAARARVVDWDADGRSLVVDTVGGTFLSGVGVVGESSGASWVASDVDDGDFFNGIFGDNNAIEADAATFVDTDEKHPFFDQESDD